MLKRTQLILVLTLAGLVWAGFLALPDERRRETEEQLILRWPWLEPLLGRN